ncbi:DUF3558 domain-containing protein [Nocardia sp. CDC160]|uniref:DUF3558 domain-containing protein n=1 Tax=Nocardia sp. CDC160 TaxID=3112166 RepID=UPI002DB94BC1|nr:DUF3558 domain-containing protein [Nocardia sp. CDC160]MEC3916277.1 DUF3558 domain-containing protein [Nocardia sp. CDC160]
MRAVGAAAGAALIGAMVAGCGSSTPQAAPSTTVAPKAVLPSPNTIGLCGGVSEADIAQQTGLSDPQRVSVNPVSCAWQASGGTDYAVVFHWFRGSSLDERRSQVTVGKPATVQVAGQPGIEWQDAASCEVAVAFGDTDFIDWTVRHTAVGCKGVEQLAAATLKQAGQG